MGKGSPISGQVFPSTEPVNPQDVYICALYTTFACFMKSLHIVLWSGRWIEGSVIVIISLAGYLNSIDQYIESSRAISTSLGFTPCRQPPQMASASNADVTFCQHFTPAFLREPAGLRAQKCTLRYVSNACQTSALSRRLHYKAVPTQGTVQAKMYRTPRDSLAPWLLPNPAKHKHLAPPPAFAPPTSN